MLRFDRYKHNVDKLTLIQKSIHKLETPYFSDAPDDTVFILPYLRGEATLKLTYAIWKCRMAPIKHKTIPKLEFQESFTVLQWLQSAHKKKQVFAANRAGDLFYLLTGISQNHWNPADSGTREISIAALKKTGWLNTLARLQTDEERGESRGAKWTKQMLSKLKVLRPQKKN